MISIELEAKVVRDWEGEERMGSKMAIWDWGVALGREEILR